MQYKPENDLCPCSRAKLLSGSSAGNRVPRLSSCVSRVYENLWMWNLSVCLCVHLCLGVKGDKKEREKERDRGREGRIVCGHVFLEIASMNVCITCVYASFNCSLTHGVCVRACVCVI